MATVLSPLVVSQLRNIEYYCSGSAGHSRWYWSRCVRYLLCVLRDIIVSVIIDVFRFIAPEEFFLAVTEILINIRDGNVPPLTARDRRHFKTFQKLIRSISNKSSVSKRRKQILKLDKF